MKHSQGARLSVLFAIVLLLLWGAMALLRGSLSPVVDRMVEFVLYTLSYPAGWVSGLFSNADGRDGLSVFVWYLILLIPNCLLLGYTLAGLIWCMIKLGNAFGIVSSADSQNNVKPSGNDLDNSDK